MALPFSKSNKRNSPVNFSAPLVLEPPRHLGLGSIALIPGRHIVGSAIDCGIRLEADGVQERHALILVGENRTIVKAMDPRTWVNDGPVSEMALRNGDRLSVGPLTFRVRLATAEESAAFAVSPVPEPVPAIKDAPPQTPPDMAMEIATYQANQLISTDSNLEKPSDVTPLVGYPTEIPSSTITPAEPTPIRSLFEDSPLPPLSQMTESHPVDDFSSVRSIDPVQPYAAALTTPPFGLPLTPSVASTPISDNFPPQPPPVPVVSPEISEPPKPTEVADPVFVEIHQTLHEPTEPPSPHVPSPPAPIVFRPSPGDVLNSRLDEIQQRLDELLQTSEFVHRRATTNRVAPSTDFQPTSDQHQLRRDELERRSEEIEAQSKELQVRAAELAERESQIERQQESLVHEAGRLAQVAETARRHVLEEHRRLSDQWKEWDEKYQLTASDLASQSEAIERHRAELRIEADRLSNARTELQRLRAECDQDRRTNSSDRARLAVEFAELQAAKTQVDSDRRQQHGLIQEFEAKLATERHLLVQERDLLEAARKELERGRASLEEERASLAQGLEQSLSQHQEAFSKLDEDRDIHQNERQELIALREKLNEESRHLQSERLRAETLRSELEEERKKLHLSQQELDTLRTNFDAASKASTSEQIELESLRRELNDQRSGLIAARQELDSLKQKLDHDSATSGLQREELESLRTELYEERNRLTQARQELDSLKANPPVDTRPSIPEREELESLRKELQEEHARLMIARLEFDSLKSNLDVSTAPTSAERQELESLRQELATVRHEFDSFRTLVDVQRVQSPTKQNHYESAPHQFDDLSSNLRNETTTSTSFPHSTSTTQLTVTDAAGDEFGSNSAEQQWDVPSLPYSEHATKPFEPSADLHAHSDSSSGNQGVSWSYEELHAPDIHPQAYSLPFSPPSPPSPQANADWNKHSTFDQQFNSSAGFGGSTEIPFHFNAVPELAVSVPMSSISRIEFPDQSLEPFGPRSHAPMISEPLGADLSPWNFASAQPSWATENSVPTGQFDHVGQDYSGGIDHTIAEVNREFGIPVADSLSETAIESEGEVSRSDEAPQLPAWWKSGPDEGAESDSPRMSPPLSGELSSFVASNEITPDHTPDPVNDLRSQLAKMFDLPEDSSSSSEPEPEAKSQTISPIEPFAPGPAPVEQTLPTPPPSASESPTGTEEADDSVEAFMARLLARSRGDAAAMTKPVIQPAPVVQAPLFGMDRPPAVDESVPSQVEDRSHLMAEPKHKQNKSEVRENLQSFRQVAHLSARTALARHSMRQLRNAVIAKGALLGASLVAATYFLAEPAFGRQIELWKASGCWLAALLAGLEFRRSLKQLHPAVIGLPIESPNTDANSEPTTSEPVPQPAPEGPSAANNQA